VAVAAGGDCAGAFGPASSVWRRNPNIPKHKVIDLATCAFVKRRRNALLLGDTGTGKSHVAQAIGHRACLLGLDVLFISAQKVFSSLRAARADDSYDRVIARYTRPELLILDDLGLRALAQDEPLDLYEIIRCQYEQGAILVTSNRAVDEWPSLFDDALMASAARRGRPVRRRRVLPKPDQEAPSER